MVYDLRNSHGNNDLKDTLSQLGAAIHGSESETVTDCVQNGSIENSNQNQPIKTQTDPHARASVDLTAMGTSLSFNPEDTNTNEGLFDDLPCDITPTFQQQLSAVGISPSIPVVTSGTR